MNIFKLAAPFALALVFAACTDGGTDTGYTGDTGNTDETEFNDQAPEIDEIEYDCGTTAANTWTYSVRTLGWAEGGISMNIYETGAYNNGEDNGWKERGHEFSQGTEAGVDFDENGEWDQWGLALSVVDKIADVKPGENTNTLYNCGTYYTPNEPSDSLAWRMWAYDDDDNDPNTPSVAADCVDFGFEPEEITEIDGPDSLCRVL